MQAISMVVVAGLLVESIITIITNIQEKETSWKYWASLALGMALSVLVSYNWNLDLFTLVGFPMGKIPFLGAILTGVVMSRGSNVLNDLIKVIINTGDAITVGNISNVTGASIGHAAESDTDLGGG